MPTPYVTKMAKRHGVTVEEAERTWEEAKRAASQNGQAKNFAYITKIFQNMMGEKGALATSIRQSP